MERAVDMLLRQMGEALASLREQRGAPGRELLDELEAIRRDRLLAAIEADNLHQAAEAAHVLELKVAELPLPQVQLSPAERAEALSLQVELLRTAAGIHHEIQALI
jgi:hypothetical protein